MIDTVAYSIFDFVINIIQLLVNIILTPINILIQPLIPDVSIINTSVNNFFLIINDIIYFVLGWLNLPDICYTFLLAYVSFLIVYLPVKLGFKVVIKLYRTWKT